LVKVVKTEISNTAAVHCLNFRNVTIR